MEAEHVAELLPFEEYEPYPEAIAEALRAMPLDAPLELIWWERYQRVHCHLRREMSRRYGADPFTFVECGVANGRTALFMLMAFPAMTYVGVDPYDWTVDRSYTSVSGEQLQSAVQRKINAPRTLAPYPQASLIMKPQVEAADDFADKSVNITWMDSDRAPTSVLEWLEAWAPKTRDALYGGWCGSHSKYEDACLQETAAEWADERGLRMVTDGVWPDEMERSWVWHIDLAGEA